jgi:hypothetical protein
MARHEIKAVEQDLCRAGLGGQPDGVQPGVAYIDLVPRTHHDGVTRQAHLVGVNLARLAAHAQAGELLGLWVGLPPMQIVRK